MRVSRALAMAREEEAWEMRQQGYRQNTIAEKLGIAESTVSEALKRIETRVLAQMSDEAAAVKARVTAQLWLQYEDLRKLFEASKAPKRAQRQRRAGGLRQEGRPEGAGIELVESKVEERIGDVAIFREMRGTLDMILKVWGGYAPQKIAPTNPAGDAPYTPDEPLSDDERSRRIKALLEEASRTIPAPVVRTVKAAKRQAVKK